MHQDVETIIADEKTIAQTVERLAQDISRDYAGQEPVMLGILKGSFIFMADLVRKLTIPCTPDFMVVSSYGAGTVPGKELKIGKEPSVDLTGRHVIIVEDILDTGNTLYYLKQYLAQRQPASLKICTLMDKPSRRVKDIQADYVGMETEDHFIVGYGLDYDEKYRGLPYIGILKPEVYEKTT